MHDLRANAFGVCREGKPLHTFPDHALGRGVHLGFGIEVGDHFLEGGNRLLHGRDLHQLPAIDRPVAILQGDDEIAALFLQLDQRQAVIGQIFHHGQVPVLGQAAP